MGSVGCVITLSPRDFDAVLDAAVLGEPALAGVRDGGRYTGDRRVVFIRSAVGRRARGLDRLGELPGLPARGGGHGNGDEVAVPRGSEG